MKRVFKAVSVWIVMSVLLASAAPLRAIGFDAERVYASVFVVYADNAVGSGFSVGGNCIVTNAHVVENAGGIYVSTYGGELYAAEVYAMDEELDIAVLTVSEALFEALPVADIAACKIGDDIYTIGAPNSMAYTLTKGVISAKERVIRKQTYLQIDAAINAGNSGGPLLNDSGEVLGMNTLKMSDSEGIGLSIPINTICDYLVSCGVSLDDSFHVSGALETRQLEAGGSAPGTDASDTETGGSDTGAGGPDSGAGGIADDDGDSAGPVLIVLLCLSGALNIALVAVLIWGKRKRAAKPDPSERTDFEIEFRD